ncbi:uncharacterized protein LOC131024942 isoform X2 [Salvia miltiorrhiza]|uniref:uncharacterized protein LOC131024942 isoform X2 n=1 Tax=Salvia miltiorrhiza TaxID=226208 RepID=UPI0025AC2E8F|nr:uncharacterized protein LOC131024942 isoform X2 [Salvia miltiorrhiza]XP_057810495.1 uncharacterized protein LOC131024942 isoform X2 [Salvia miltiorrhiza]XP_057810496.1 uncharacterized protein LOC131024942 isoform X2 [Salvia miltiorrhiza]XP_057810497.1 uncharacterized protein LOC131024942 isoform X2 [Salvia miltiorrhiza]
MVGGGNRRDEASFTVSNTNVFAALESLRKKKKSDKEKGSSKGGKGTSKAAGRQNAEAEKQVFWAPAPLTVKSWADVDDEDDDDYYATTAPPQAIWGGSGLNAPEETHKPDVVEESESEDELLDEGDDDVEDGHDQEPEVEEQPEPLVTKPAEATSAPKETERQLSKKERRKKELAELEAILADFGVNPKEKAEDEASSDVAKEQKEGQSNGNADKKDNPPAESKSAKKKKKKEKAAKEVKESQDSDVPNGQEETAGTEQADEDTSAVDVKERLKRVASSKKKKSNKEMDAAAKAAAVEAAARSKRLAAAKKKEKNHYNQQPIR